MKMFWHEDVCNDLETEANPKLVEGVDEVLAEAVGMIELRPVVGAGGNEVEMARTVEAMQWGHEGILTL
jgi:hypothetical protein